MNAARPASETKPPSQSAMRLTLQQSQIILSSTRQALGEGIQVRLFGSRVDDDARGGDVDLYVETREAPEVWTKARLLAELEHRLGLPVDLVVHVRDEPERPIHRIAKLTGVVLS
jgi:predicted nucleotidyltransferase